VGSECFANVEVLAGDFNLHGCEYPSPPLCSLRHGRAKCYRQ
jgi:hypothetical protein